MTAIDPKALQRQLRSTRSALRKLIDETAKIHESIDATFSAAVWRSLPEVERGKRLAQIANYAEHAADVGRMMLGELDKKPRTPR